MIIKKGKNRIQALAKKWQKGQITEQEKAEFNMWYTSFDDTQLEEFSKDTTEALRDRMYKVISSQENIPGYIKPNSFGYLKLAAAAIILLFLSSGMYFILKLNPKNKAAYNTFQNDKHPGTNKAILTLADGTKISLDDATSGKIAEQAGISITKTSNGHLIYTVADTKAKNVSQKVVYNTIETPRGGQYQVNLPDGTKLWLNAASSIKFPTAFTGNERSVQLTGEAYFEVAKNEHVPFVVEAASIKVHVLGTHFNVMAYEGEGVVKTTLQEGSVKLTGNNANALLKPGEQGSIEPGASTFTVSNVDVSAAIAWKNGMFLFDNTDLRSLMRQLSRWYNVEVVYEGEVKNDLFIGKIKRASDLSKVLKILELGDIHFRIEDNKLIVMP